VKSLFKKDLWRTNRKLTRTERVTLTRIKGAVGDILNTSAAESVGGKSRFGKVNSGFTLGDLLFSQSQRKEGAIKTSNCHIQTRSLIPALVVYSLASSHRQKEEGFLIEHSYGIDHKVGYTESRYKRWSKRAIVNQYSSSDEQGGGSFNEINKPKYGAKNLIRHGKAKHLLINRRNEKRGVN